MWIFSLKEEEGFVIKTVDGKETRMRVLKVWKKDGEESVFIGISSSMVFSGKEEEDMLVITRKKNEKIIIGDNIIISIVKINDRKVRLGIEAPEEVSIWRQEIYDTIKQKKENPSSS